MKKKKILSSVFKKYSKQICHIIIALTLTFSASSLKSQVIYNWFPASSGTTANLYSANGKFIVGAGGVILFTSNNGINWILQSSGTTADLRSIQSTDNLTLAVGAGGTILRSTDLGVNWSQINSGVSEDLNSVARAMNNVYYAAGENGRIVYSSNGGLNWIAQQTPTTNELRSISFYGFYGWAAGVNGTLIFTTNSGQNWGAINTGTSVNLNSVVFQSQYTGWLAGSAGLILKTTNSGFNWYAELSGTTSELKCITTVGWSCGYNGTILHNVNSYWTPEPQIPLIDLNTIFYNGTNCITAGNYGNILVRRIDSLYLNYYHFTPNNIWTYFINTGIFNQNINYPNTPGFQWPAGSGKYAVFTSGLTIAAKVNGAIRMSAASYQGEYYPGFAADSSGFPVGRTDSRFRFYKIKRGDNVYNSIDWLNWGVMVPFGAPYIDVNHNGTYEPAIDSPGVRGASQTLFLCMTDGFPARHLLSGEGFGGGTLPLFSEVHMTVWGYDNPGYQDMHFIKWEIINKNTVPWYNTYFALYCDPDLGFAEDDYIGCDSARNLGYCYNADNDDNGSSYSYGVNPPAVGFKFLNCAGYSSFKMKAFTYTICNGCSAPVCELNPFGEPEGAYNFMKGMKKDGTPWVIPNTNPPQTTKFVYSGDPETGTGWTEFGGKIWNCDSMLTGQWQVPVPPGDRRLVMGTGSENLTVNPGDTQKVVIVQLIARGSNNLNSVTILKHLSDAAQRLCDSGFVIGAKQISLKLPGAFNLNQNYPNPFNPLTKIKYAVPYRVKVNIKVYDLNGREVSVLVKEVQNAGEYSVEWNAENFASGVYFYKLQAGDFNETKKMVLIK